MTEPEKIEGAVTAIRCFVPGFNLKLKSKSTAQKLIGRIMSLLGNRLYMFCYWTTIGKTVYRPTACNLGPLKGEWEILLHEGRHADDCYKLGPILYNFLYLFPQIFGILGVIYALALIPALLLGAPVALLWGLLSLLCLLPLPAPFRAAIEARAYMVSMCVDFWAGEVTDWKGYIDDLVEKVTGPSYYHMWPFKGMIRRYFEGCLEDLRSGTIELDAYLMMCRTKSKVYK